MNVSRPAESSATNPFSPYRAAPLGGSTGPPDGSSRTAPRQEGRQTTALADRAPVPAEPSTGRVLLIEPLRLSPELVARRANAAYGAGTAGAEAKSVDDTFQDVGVRQPFRAAFDENVHPPHDEEPGAARDLLTPGAVRKRPVTELLNPPAEGDDAALERLQPTDTVDSRFGYELDHVLVRTK